MINPDIICDTRDADDIVRLLRDVGVEVDSYYENDHRPQSTHVTVKVGNLDAIEFIMAGLEEHGFDAHYE